MTRPSELVPGQLIALDLDGFRFRPWVVHEVLPFEDRWRVWVRPLGAEFDFAQINRGVTFARWASAIVLPEHYSVCVCCGELPPCSAVWTADVAEKLTERAARYETEGICPACEEVITHRQRSIRFEENLHVPLGPPVTFHRRGKCWSSAIDYDRSIARATGRAPILSCEGRQVRHEDGARECDAPGCPGEAAQHRSWSICAYEAPEPCSRCHPGV
jgi:hypothetical protein